MMERKIMFVQTVVLLLACLLSTLKAARPCRRPPPGLVAMTRAVDITKLDFLPQDPTADSGFGRRLIHFTCDEGKRWRSPDEPATTYDLPDQVETINVLPGGVLDTTYHVFRDSRVATSNMSAELGVSFRRGMFSLSATYRRLKHAISDSSRVVSTVSAHFSSVQADLMPYWEQKLIRSAQTFVNRMLATTFAANSSERFNDFIRRYGTHYIESGKFGGLFKVNIEVEESLAQRMSEKELEVNAQGTFFKVLKAKGAYQGGSTEVSEEYRGKSHLTTRFYGGNINLLAQSSWSSWWPTVAGNPWLFGGRLDSIANLIKNSGKRQALEEAIQVYLDKAYLKEVQRTLSASLGKGRAGEAQVRHFYDQATTLLGKSIPEHDEVTTLATNVDKLINMPHI